MNKPSLRPATRALLAGVALMAVISVPLAGSATGLANAPFHLRADNIEKPSTYAIKPGIKKATESGSEAGGGSTTQPGTGTGGSTSPATPPVTTPPTTEPTPSKPSDPNPDLISITMDTRKCNYSTISFQVASSISLPDGSDPKAIATVTEKLPVNGTVSWGDGSTSTLAYGSMSHTYSTKGEYTMELRGIVGGLTTSSASSCYTKINHMGDETGIRNLDGFLSGTSYLTEMAEPPVTLQTARNMFSSNIGFNGDTSQWTLPNLVDAGGMFQSAQNFNGDLGKLDTGKLLRAGAMFRASYAFEGKGLQNWNTSNLRQMGSMFANTSVFTGDVLANWDVSRVFTFDSTFMESNFNGSLSGWNPESAITVANMFKKNKVFNQPIDNWNLSKATDFSYMFSDALKFNQPINGWKVGNGVIFTKMFYRDGTGTIMAFNQPLDKWDTGSATTMTGMFWGATNMAQDLSMWNVPNVRLKDAFAASTKMTTAQLPKWVK